MRIFNDTNYNITIQPISEFADEKEKINEIKEENMQVEKDGHVKIHTWHNEKVKYLIQFDYGGVLVTINDGKVENASMQYYIHETNSQRKFSVINDGYDTMVICDKAN